MTTSTSTSTPTLPSTSTSTSTPTSTPSSSSSVDISIIHPALGSHPSDSRITTLLTRLGANPTEVQVGSFPDGEFHNYYTYGFTLFFARNEGGDDGGLKLDRIDFYNPSSSSSSATDGAAAAAAGGSRRRRKPIPQYSPSPTLVFNFPNTTLAIPNPPPPNPDLPPPKPRPSSTPSTSTNTAPKSISRPKTLIVDRQTTAQNLVESLGEPSKKGGKPGWIDTYMEWTTTILDSDGVERKVGILVELKEGKGEGMTVWDRASGWEWACLKVFSAE